LAVEYLGKAKSRGKHLVTGYASAGGGTRIHNMLSID
jgi:hypothetical protein